MYYFAPLIFLFLFVCYVGCTISSKEKSYEDLPGNRGKITKFEYEGHSYIGWTCNMGCSMVHDPDCKCIKDNSSSSS